MLIPIFEKHKIKKTVLFGFYARGYVTDNSDIDEC